MPLQDFIDRAPSSMDAARYSAARERSVGLGAMGFHSYLQTNAIPFESALARSANLRMFRHLRTQADAASRAIAGTVPPFAWVTDEGEKRFREDKFVDIARVVMARRGARRIGLPSASKPSSTWMDASSGRTSAAGASRSSNPRSTSCSAATEVIALVMDAIQNTESSLIAASAAMSRRPNAPA